MQSASINWRPLGELFVETGLISADELEEALAEQDETGGRLGEILLSQGLVSPPELTRTLADQLGRELDRERPNGLSADAAPADDDPSLLLRRVDELRDRLTREFAAREAELVEKMSALENRLATFEETLADERAAHRRTQEELERGRSEAGQQAAELRSCLGRIRGELANIDAGMAWFEYWASSAPRRPEAPPS